MNAYCFAYYIDNNKVEIYRKTTANTQWEKIYDGNRELPPLNAEVLREVISEYIDISLPLVDAQYIQWGGVLQIFLGNKNIL